MDFNRHIERFEAAALRDAHDERETNATENDAKILRERAVREGRAMCDEEGGDGAAGFGGAWLRDSGEREDARRPDVGFGVHQRDRSTKALGISERRYTSVGLDSRATKR
jgi:hypothetical protein